MVCSSAPMPSLWGMGPNGAWPVITALTIVAAMSSSARPITAGACLREGQRPWARIPIAETTTANTVNAIPAT